MMNEVGEVERLLNETEKLSSSSSSSYHKVFLFGSSNLI